MGIFECRNSDGTVSPLVNNYAFLVSDYMERCDQCRFKSANRGLCPCRVCLVPGSRISGEGHQLWGLKSVEGRESVYKGEDVPVTLKEYLRRHPPANPVASADDTAESGVNAEKLATFLNFINLHNVAELRE